MAERGFSGLPNVPNTQNRADHRLSDSGFRAGVAGVQRTAHLRDVAVALRSKRVAQGVAPATSDPVDFMGGMVVLCFFAGLGLAVGLLGLLLRV